MTIDWIPGVPASNYSLGREGNPISLIVDHWMAGSFASALARFRDPASVVSAHYLVSTDGRVAQIVRDDDTAYHAGNWQVNLNSIGIEHEAGPMLAPSGALYQASAALHRQIAQNYGFPLIVGDTVKPHRAIVATACPGTLDLNRIVEEVVGSVSKDAYIAADPSDGKSLEDRVKETDRVLWVAEFVPQMRAELAAGDASAETKAVVEAVLDVLESALKPKP